MFKTDREPIVEILSSCITKKKYLPFIYKHHFNETQDDNIDEEEEESSEESLASCVEFEEVWLPKASIVYSYTEDVDPIKRINSAHKAFDCNVICESCKFTQDEYSEQGAQSRFLTSNPISFWIIGKPGLDEKEIGKIIADHWNCVYIDPEVVLNEEIKSQSRPGKCIEFNLRCGRTIGSDIIMNLVERRINSKSAQHRGFVLAGLPLIPNNFYTFDDPVATEAAVFSANETIDYLIESLPTKEILGEENLDENEGEISLKQPANSLQNIWGDLGTITSKTPLIEKGQKFSSADKLEENMMRIYESFKSPFIIIYLMCPNDDVLNKRENLRYDIYSRNTINLENLSQKEKPINILLNRNQKGLCTSIVNIPVGKPSIHTFVDSNHFKHLVKQPCNFKDPITVELDNYHNFILPMIDRFIIAHDPQYVLKIDGRMRISKLYNTIRERLRVLTIQKVVLAEKLINKSKNETEGEGGEEEGAALDLEGQTPENCFKQLSILNRIVPKFKWQLSNFRGFCPVAMREGRLVVGDPNLTIRFMNKLYFPENEDAARLFCRNPRPYLLPPFPRPPCKMLAFGPKHCGASDLALCLHYIYDAKIIDYDEILENYKLKVERSCRHQIYLNAIETGPNILYQDMVKRWNEGEAARKELVASWQIKILKLYEKYNSLLPESNRVNFSNFKEIIKLFPEYYGYIIDATITSTTALFTYYMEMIEFSQEEEQNEENITEENNGLLDYVTTILEDYYVPITPEFISEVIQKPDILLPYLPSRLQPIPEPVKPKEADDIVIEYAEKEAADAVIDEITVTEDDIVNICAEAIFEAEYVTALNSDGVTTYGGWIIINLLPSLNVITSLLDKGFVIDEVFSFVDEDEGNEYILNKYNNKTLLRPYRFMKDFLKFYGYNEASTKAHTIDLPSEEIAEYILDYILNRDWFNLGEIFAPEIKEEGEDGFIDDSIPDVTVPTAATTVASSVHGDYDLLEEEDLQPVSSFLILLDFLNAYMEGWKELENFFIDENIEIISLQYPHRDIGDIMHEALLKLHRRYQTQPELYSDEDKEAELLEETTDIIDEEDVGEEEDENPLKNRRFGDTKDYCPIALYKHGVLWKGKDQFTVQFDGKLYLLSSENAQNEFMENPRQFVPLQNIPNVYPKLRICVTGPIGVGKTVLAKRLSVTLGLAYVNFLELIDLYLIPSGYPLPGRKNTSVFLNLNPPPEPELTRDLEKQQEFLSIINQYYTAGVPMPDEFLRQLLFRLWNREPYLSTGIVLDGFPICESDFKFMETYYLIPNFIIQLDTHQGIVQSRLIDNRYENWKIIMEMEKQKKEQMNELELETYREFKELRVPQIKNDILIEKAMALIDTEEFSVEKESVSGLSPIKEELSETEEVNPVLLQKALEMVTQAANDEEITNEALNRFESDNPEPIFDDKWESEDAAMERLIAEIDGWYDTEATAMANFTAISKEINVPLFVINSSKTLDEVFLKTIHTTSYFIFSSSSLYETVFEITIEEAEALLQVGYFFLSRFGRTCPVQTYFDSCPLQLFLPLEQKTLIFPVTHRQYIYFIAGKKHLELFKTNPLKFVAQEKHVLPLIPLRVSLIGPPKCGKSTLACRLKKELGLKVVTRGQSIRFVLEEYPQSSLAKEIDDDLRSGEELRYDLVIKAVDAYCFEGRAVSQGIVFDGFPQCDDEYMEMAAFGLTPHLIIDCKANVEYSHKCLSNENSQLKYMPLYSHIFLDHRYEEWENENMHFQEWAWNNYQNVHSIECKYSKWSNWTEANKIICDVFGNIVNYIINFHFDMPWNMEHMCITPAEFRNRQSTYLNYCPCCFIQHRKLIRSSTVPPRKNMFQYNHHYYYICDEHVTLFLNEAKFFLPPINNTKLPRELPRELLPSEQTRNVPSLFQDGYCIVTFWDKQPDHFLVRGLVKFSVFYKGQTYRFCSKECLETFITKPHIYANLKIHFKNTKEIRPLDCNNLPTLGYLQQYESKLVTQACTNTGILRPKYPCLSPELSAIINVALYLKIHNSNTSFDELNIFKKYIKDFKFKCHQLITAIALSKRIINPYLKYPILTCENKAVLLPSIESESTETTSEISIPQIEEKSEDENDSSRSHLFSISFHSSELALLTVDMDASDS